MASEDAGALRAVAEGAVLYKFLSRRPGKPPHERHFHVSERSVSWTGAGAPARNYRILGANVGLPPAVERRAKSNGWGYGEHGAAGEGGFTILCERKGSVAVLAESDAVAQLWVKGLNLMLSGDARKGRASFHLTAAAAAGEAVEKEGLETHALAGREAEIGDGVRVEGAEEEEAQPARRGGKKRRLAVSAEVYTNVSHRLSQINERRQRLSVDNQSVKKKAAVEKSTAVRDLLLKTMDNAFIFRGMPQHARVELVDSCFQHVVKRGDRIITQDEVVCEHLYIIERGRYDVIKESEEVLEELAGGRRHSAGPLDADDLVLEVTGDLRTSVGAKVSQASSFAGSSGKKVWEYGTPGEFFGELAMLYDAPRAATVVCASEKGVLWVVTRAMFQRLVVATSRGSHVAQFLREVPLFRNVPERQLTQAAAHLEELTCAPGELVARAGEKDRSMFIVMHGTVKATKKRENGEEDENEAVVFEQGQFFGERQAFVGSPREHTYTCTSADAKILKVSHEVFRLLEPQLEQVLHDQMILSVIRSIEELEHLDDKQVEEVLDDFELKEYKKGALLVADGAPPRALFIVKQGCLQHHGKTYGPYMPFGAAELLQEEAVEKSVFVGADSTLCFVLPEAHFKRMIDDAEGSLRLKSVREALHKVELFQGLSKEETTALANSLVAQKFSDGEAIIAQGDVGDKFYVMKSGEVVVTKKSGDSDRAKEVLRLGPGSVFGERALLLDEPRAASVFAVGSKVVCLGLTRAKFEQLLGPLADSLASHQRTVEAKEAEQQTRFEDLTTLTLLGCGHFGRVTLVQHKYTHATYALKAMEKLNIYTSNQVSHVIAERNVLSQIEHPFCIHLKRTFHDAHHIYMLTDVALGGELFSIIDDAPNGRLPEASTRFYAACVIVALQYVHAAGYMYRDLKPENLLIDGDGYVKVVDFGFAKEIKGKTYTLCGTPEYMAPEVVKREGHNHAVDVWGIGILIYEMLVGRTPFTVAEDPDDLKGIYENIVDHNYVFTKSCPEDAMDLIEKLLEYQPEKRLGMYRPKQLREHAWFSSIDFQALEKKKLVAPWVPPLKSDADSKHFAGSADSPPRAKKFGKTPPVDISFAELDAAF